MKKKLLSVLLILSLVMSFFVTADILYPGMENLAMASESSVMGSNGYSGPERVALTAGTTYTFGGIPWIAAEVKNDYAVLQAATSVASGSFPSRHMNETVANAAGNKLTFTGDSITAMTSLGYDDIGGYDISVYNGTLTELYHDIKAAEYSSAIYGKGLFLISKDHVGSNSAAGNYRSGLKKAAEKNREINNSGMAEGAWLGSLTKAFSGNNEEYKYIDKSGNIFSDVSACNFAIAPAFNLDTSKVKLTGTALTVFEESTEISAVQSITSITEGQTVDLSTVIPSVTYLDGTNSGQNAAYKITASVGSINGTQWTAPTGINAEQSVVLTVTETGSSHNLTTSKQISVTPRNASSISVGKQKSFPDTIISGESIDLSAFITVTGYDSGNQSDGIITAYNLSSNEGVFNGTTYTAGPVESRKTITITVTATGSLGSVNYSGQTTVFSVEVVSVNENTAENDFMKNYGTYQSVMNAISGLKAKVDAWKEEIAILTGLTGDSLDDLALVKSALEQRQQELLAYTRMYNDLTAQLSALIASTDIDSTGYLATIRDTETQAERTIVYLNGAELDAADTGSVAGDKKLYTATGDLGEGNQILIFYVSEDGVHVTTINGVEQSPEKVYSDGIKAMQRKLNAQVTALRQLLSGYEDLIPEFKTLLSITEENFDQLSGPEQLQIVYTYVQSNVKEKQDVDAALDSLFLTLKVATGSLTKSRAGQTDESAADKINSISEMVKQLSDSYNANNAYLRDNICDIDIAYGYGHYVKYNDKYVFAIYENGSLTYYIKTDGGRTYLANNGDGTFHELTEQEMLASAYNDVNGAKYLYLTDTENGYNPYVNNPLPTYKLAMASLISGFNSYHEKTDALIDALNTINGKVPGDAGYIFIPTGADADTVNAVMAAALESLKAKLNSLELQRATFSSTMAEIAKVLDDYLAGDYSDVTDVSAEEAAEILLAARNAVADLEMLRGQMRDVDDALKDLYDALFSAFDDMGIERNREPAMGRNEESTADKIESITDMVAQITASYNALKAEYASLEANYQKVIDAVYGEDEKTAAQVTATQIINQIEKNKQDEITNAVKKALEDADNFDEQSTVIQQSIADIIEKILDGENVDTSDLDPALQIQLATVMEMKAEINGMHQDSDTYASFLTTLRGALSLDSTADTAAILESIQGLKSQVTTLSGQLSAANTTISKIQTKLSTQATGDELVAQIGTKGDGDITGAYQEGYNAGYVAGTKGVNHDSSNAEAASLLTNAYQNGYNAGYVAGTQSSKHNNADNTQIAGLMGQITTLTRENTSLESEKVLLASQIDTLHADIEKLASKNNELSATNKRLLSGNASLTSRNEALNSENKRLTNKNNRLLAANQSYSSDNTSLASRNEVLNSENRQLSQKNEQLSAANNVLNDRVGTLEKRVSSLAKDRDKESLSTQKVEEGEDAKAPVTPEDSENASEGSQMLPTPLPDNVVEIRMPSSDTVLENKSADLIELANNVTYLTLFDANAGAVFETTDEQKERANKIFAYYANHPEMLAQLGWEGILTILDEENKMMTVHAIASLDVEPSETQKNAFENGGTCVVDLSGEQIHDGKKYLVVHESNTRVGMFDVILVEAQNGSISFELADLSPISVAEVGIREKAASFDNVVSDIPSGTHDSTIDTGTNSILKSIFIILLILATVIAAVTILILQKRGKLRRA